jgi:stalled ribosome alternative rescue factor ArfA
LAADGIVSDKKIKNEELAALVASALWKQEKAKKEKK